VRFSTAAHIFLFGTLPFLFENKKKYLFIAISSVFVHFSFIFPITILLLFILVPKNIHVFFILFVISTFFVQINFEAINSALSAYAPDVLQDRVSSYGNIDYKENIESHIKELHWYIQIFINAISYVIIAFVISIYSFGRIHLKNNPKLFLLFCFSLLIISSANLISVFPSGFRFIIVSQLFGITSFVLMIGLIKFERWFQILRIFTTPILALYIIIGIRYFVDVTGFSTYISNPFLSFIFQDSEPIIKVIKTLLK